VVFTRDATIGLAAITGTEMAVSQHLIAWVPGPRIQALFLLRVFDAIRKYLDKFTFGATIKTIGMDDVRSLCTPLPPINEQAAIAHAIAKQTARIDKLKSAINREMQLLAEYRSALITNAVTGKIDVRAEVG
jgi:type I restriction enzyme S subunit